MLLRRVLPILALLLGAAAIAAPNAVAHRRHHSRPHRRHPHGHSQSQSQSQPAAVPATCANADTQAGTAPTQAIDDAVVCLVNQQRVWRGLPALQASAQLDRSAQNWTNVMVANEIFTHGSDFASRISAVGLAWTYAGENIATGYSTPATVVTAWMASPDHCQNILDPNYALVGTGVSAQPIAPLSSGPGTWTQDFALTGAAQPPSHNGGPAQGCPYQVSIH